MTLDACNNYYSPEISFARDSLQLARNAFDSLTLGVALTSATAENIVT